MRSAFPLLLALVVVTELHTTFAKSKKNHGHNNEAVKHMKWKIDSGQKHAELKFQSYVESLRKTRKKAGITKYGRKQWQRKERKSFLKTVGLFCGIDPSIMQNGDRERINNHVKASKDCLNICDAIACDLPYPKSYIAYHLRGEKITTDGRLEERAWLEVPWTDAFIDIQGAQHPTPRFQTRAKMRYDDEYLYIAARIDEPDIWANQTEHDSVIFQDNDFEVFIDPGSSTHGYKEYEMNALNTYWDLELNKPYMNGGSPNSSFEMAKLKRAVFINGTINDPSDTDNYWSVEIAMPFSDLIRDTPVTSAPPGDKDQWRINFSRVEWKVRKVGKHYEKIPKLKPDNWVWSSQRAINMHIPERWGLVEFRNTSKVGHLRYNRWQKWTVLSGAFQFYYAMKEFWVNNGYYSKNVKDLRLSPAMLNGRCVTLPQFSETNEEYRFNLSVRSVHLPRLMCMIQDDRFTQCEIHH
ncbi:unnamed protein product [Owenia fusiformis]|uniref:Uncharacterized protein n=1 Tax=Owenia fusiformis TaxID=6347 RepID=A0A8J1XRR2_OWEFU|nr:unnamed protein product [Owenia fusiformis]